MSSRHSLPETQRYDGAEVFWKRIKLLWSRLPFCLSLCNLLALSLPLSSLRFLPLLFPPPSLSLSLCAPTLSLTLPARQLRQDLWLALHSPAKLFMLPSKPCPPFPLPTPLSIPYGICASSSDDWFWLRLWLVSSAFQYFQQQS